MGYRTIKLKRTGLKISSGNTGMGKVYNVSKDQSTCGKMSVKCKPYCYLGSAYYRSMKGVVACHKANGAILSNLDDPKIWNDLDNDMLDFVEKYDPKTFRVSVNGDLANIYELAFWNMIALYHCDINILIFTKRLGILEQFVAKFEKAKNLRIKVSVFFNYTQNEINRSKSFGYPIAYTDTENRLGFKTCKKPCESCGWCFKFDSDVYLPLHGPEAKKKKRLYDEKVNLGIRNLVLSGVVI